MQNGLPRSKSALITSVDSSFYEKPPTAAPSLKKKRKSHDDTPKSFLRLVNWKSRKELIAEGKLEIKNKPNLTIEKGESLHDFRRYICSDFVVDCRRVDKEIPVRLGGMNREQRPKKKPKAKPETDDMEDDIPKKKR
jgi:hypothetical protein